MPIPRGKAEQGISSLFIPPSLDKPSLSTWRCYHHSFLPWGKQSEFFQPLLIDHCPVPPGSAEELGLGVLSGALHKPLFSRECEVAPGAHKSPPFQGIWGIPNILPIPGQLRAHLPFLGALLIVSECSAQRQSSSHPADSITSTLLNHSALLCLYFSSPNCITIPLTSDLSGEGWSWKSTKPCSCLGIIHLPLPPAQQVPKCAAASQVSEGQRKAINPFHRWISLLILFPKSLFSAQNTSLRAEVIHGGEVWM